MVKFASYLILIICFLSMPLRLLSQVWEYKANILNNTSRQRIQKSIAIFEDTLGNHLTFSNVTNGELQVNLPVKKANLILNAFGFHTFQKRIDFTASEKKIEQIYLRKDTTYLLREVLVIPSNKGIYDLPDTLIFKVKNLKIASDRKIEDVLKRLPGIEVDETSGQIKYRNKNISTVLIDGENVVDRNYTLATKNLSVDDIDEVQAIEHFSENSIISELGSSNEVALNLTFNKKITISNNTDLSAGVIEDMANALGVQSTAILNSKRIKSLINGGFNNLGENNSKINYNSFNSSDKFYDSQPERIFQVGGAFLNTPRQKISRNNQKTVDVSALLKFHKNLKVRINSMGLNDSYGTFQKNTTLSFLPDLVLETSDKYAYQTAVKKWDHSIYTKFQPSRDFILEGTFSNNTSNIDYSSNQTINSMFGFQSNKASGWNDQFVELLATLKLNKKAALQINSTRLKTGSDFTLAFEYQTPLSFNREQIVHQASETYRNSIKLIQVFLPKYLISETKMSQLSISQPITTPVKSLSSYQEKELALTQNFKGKFRAFEYNLEASKTQNKIRNSQIFNAIDLLNYQVSLGYKIQGQQVRYDYKKLPKTNYRGFIVSDTLYLDNRNLRFDSLSANIPVEQSHSLFVNNSPTSNFYYLFGLYYSKVNSDYFNITQISSLSTFNKNAWIDQPTEMISSNLEMNYFVKPLSINVKGIIDWNEVSLPLFLNQIIPTRVKSSTFHWGFNVRTGFLKTISILNQVDVYRNTISNQGNSTVNTTLKNQFGLYYRKKQAAIRLVMQSFKYGPTINLLHFLDTALEVNPAKSKFTYGLKANNLLNNTSKNYLMLSNYGQTSFENFIIGRSILATVTIGF